MDLAGLIDQTFGPRHSWISPDGVRDFVEATGDDPKRWVTAAPPGFMSVALFAVAPDLLGLLYEHSVIHGEQSFTWDRALSVGTELKVTGRVTRARERSGVHFITFEMEAADEEGRVATGSALFLAAGGSAPASAAHERTEPEATDRGDPAKGQLSASRSDLIRYAAATRDWNPIHWDHNAAVAAGLPGVVVHGLLQANWALRHATVVSSSDRPLAAARIRFRTPLLPANPVTVASNQDGSTINISLTDDADEYITARVELADE
jgi:acyl dehydratase